MPWGIGLPPGGMGLSLVGVPQGSGVPCALRWGTPQGRGTAWGGCPPECGAPGEGDTQGGREPQGRCVPGLREGSVQFRSSMVFCNRAPPSSSYWGWTRPLQPRPQPSLVTPGVDAALVAPPSACTCDGPSWGLCAPGWGRWPPIPVMFLCRAQFLSTGTPVRVVRGPPALNCLSQARCCGPGLGLVDLGIGVLGGASQGTLGTPAKVTGRLCLQVRRLGVLCPGTPVSGVVCCGLVLTTLLPNPGFLLIRVRGPGQLGPHNRGDACRPPVSPDAPSGAPDPQPPARLPPPLEHSCGRLRQSARGCA